MKHSVFCAANIPENQQAIQNALKAREILETKWDEDACITGSYEGSNLSLIDSHNNVEIYAMDEYLPRLIDTCMAFQREYTELRLKNI